LSTALTQYWISRSHQKEGRRYLEELLAVPTQDLAPGSRAAALEAVVEIAVWQVTTPWCGTPPTEAAGIVHSLEQARTELTTERYDAAVVRGRETPIEEIVQLALALAAGALDGAGGTFVS
jgi:hypothetical protein